MSSTLLEQTEFGSPGALPDKRGLYDPAFEKDSCGVGFVAHIKGKASHQIVVDAEIMLQRMEHRGGCGCEPTTGDGAGILTGMPDAFCRKVAQQDLAVDLPAAGLYAVGNVFLPTEEDQRVKCIAEVEKIIIEQGQKCLGWREVPVDTEGADIGPTARRSQPVILQLYIEAVAVTGKQFERQLYVIRKRCTHLLRHDQSLSQRKMFYICSLSPSVIIYKGMLNALQVKTFYLDLQDNDFASHIAMVHSRFSTNTFPSWDRAQPNRYMSHNGEINTLLGNRNWMTARQGMVQCDDFDCAIESLFPIAENDCSDSGNFDNVLEFLLMSGRSLPEAVMLMVPEAWQSDENMDQAKKDFYRFNSAMMEPWDGPASIAFTDGHCIGAVLDRNGLRPSRYYLTNDDRVIMASEVGVVDVDPAEVKFKGRLQPGKMFLIDFDKGELITDEVLKKDFSTRQPYGEWLANQEIKLSELGCEKEPHGFEPKTIIPRMQAFGYTVETMQFMLLPLVRELRDPVGSMGNDAALACLSDKPRMIYDYFKQLFAQVTNPAIDSIREEVVMSLECYIGPEGNLLETTEKHAHRLRIPHPILTNEELAALKHLNYQGWKTKTIDITYDKAEGVNGLAKCLDKICVAASDAIAQGYSLVVLSDRKISASRVPVSTLLATGAVHHHLVKNQQRTRIGIVLETGEAREVHQHCLLIGYGADAINPYLAFEALFQSQRDGLLDVEKYNDESLIDKNIVAAYRKGVAKGMLKVMAKIGISTLHSYKGAQIFEAVGLGEEVIKRCFKGTASRIKGVSLEVLAEESLRRHEKAWPPRDVVRLPILDNPGDFHWRSGGEVHMWNPKTIASIQLAARNNSREAYKQFAKVSDDDSTRRATLRGLLKFKEGVNGGAIPLDEVEPASAIVKRFVTGAMSFGSISAESHEALAIAMNRMGGKSNTGEGGEDASRFIPMANGDSKRSAIKQIASGRFGVTNWYLTNADELQIKVSQGAKPGEGGELPGAKVDDNIARIRHSTPGVGLISPPPHHDIYSIEDLAQLIHDLKNANPSARISVKLVAEIGVGTIASGVTKAFSDHIVIAGHDGGTGASPLTSVKHAGLPWELGVAETHQTLVMNDLRSRVVLQTDGQLKTGRDITIAALLGAEEFGFSTAPLITLGCIMMRKCHLNTCPVGIATQDKALRKKFSGKPEYVVNYLFMVAEDMREHMASLGFRSVNEMIGRVDVLEMDAAINHWKASGIDLTALLTPAQKSHENVDVYHTQAQNHGLEKALDNEIIKRAKAAIDNGDRVVMDLPVVNTNRVVGTMLSHELAKAHLGKPLVDNTVHIKLTGSAGQSLGAWLYQGVNIELEGDANDYAGKGLSGGRLIVYPPKNSSFVAEENIIVGNTVLYGATAGEAYFRGIAAERFCVRNSGAKTVVEGVGDHGCEYMTGGRVIVLGKTGRNFAAGMSGGIAYIWDKNKSFTALCNMGMVELEALELDEDIDEVKTLIKNHLDYTGSSLAKAALGNWSETIKQFVKVMPTDYKRVLLEMKKQEEQAA